MEFIAARLEVEKSSFKFWHLDIFDDDKKLGEIMGDMPNLDDYDRKKDLVVKEINKVSPELRQFYCEPLLTKTQEFHLFRKMNYLKYKAYRFYNWYCKSKLNKLKQSFLDHLVEAHTIRNLIVCCNTRLAANVYKKRKDLYGESVDNLLSDCFTNIIKAADGFDYRRGFKFSTYCTWVLMNNSLRDHQADKKFSDMFSTNIEDLGENQTGDTEALEKDLDKEKKSSIQKDIMTIFEILTKRDPREAEIISQYYGIKDGKKKTLKEISDNLQITKERVRQIKNSAIEYLQELLKIGNIDFKTSDFF
jgi:RNA polymerase sigma factor (sigma-70 family)